jgi:hypothetical protein
MYDVCGAWQLFVPARGFMHFDQLHPGSSVPLPITTSPRFTISTFPFSNVLTSSGELRLFANTFAAVDDDILVKSKDMIF